jgi:HAD superfamily hydrolase (TIGR01549 family)
MLKWVFFDIGNVLFNDDQQAFFGYRSLYEALREIHPGQTFAELMSAREAEARQGRQWIISRIAKSRLPAEQHAAWSSHVTRSLAERYDEFHLVNPHTIEILSELRRHYRLGVIANQTLACRPSLVRRGLAEFFDVIGISDEVGASKPEPELFRWALNKAECVPEEAVMIGDRLDNDIAPAHELGFRTLLVDWLSPEHKIWQPEDPLAREFLASCARVALFPLGSLTIRPDTRVGCLSEIPGAVRAIARSPAKLHD